jgi:hypothetical protein
MFLVSLSYECCILEIGYETLYFGLSKNVINMVQKAVSKGSYVSYLVETADQRIYRSCH